MQIAFIGLGNMGAPMARNLRDAGHSVLGFDRALTPDDIPCAPSVSQAVDGAEVVIFMLPNGTISRSVVDQVLPRMAHGALLMDCSTIDVATARDTAARASEYGVQALDAPVSGGIAGAANGTLTFMVGGGNAAFDRAKPLFDIMGQRAVHCGLAGNGQAAKICNNMILGATMIATCEAFGLADTLGLDRQAMFDVVSTSSGYSWSMNAYCPVPGVGPASPADNAYRPGFAAGLMAKDLTLSQQAADTAGAHTPMGAQALALYQAFIDDEHAADRDFSAIINWLNKDHKQS
ncbi:MAG: 3-hydroxyisobutyrate dehydrogenase [Pseudomonadota bacterium]